MGGVGLLVVEEVDPTADALHLRRGQVRCQIDRCCLLSHRYLICSTRVQNLEAFTALAFDTPLAIVGSIIAVFLYSCAWCGLRLGLYQRNQSDDEKSTDVMLGTLLALLGLLIAFTYAFALDRHSSRKSAVLLEANSLGTAYLRADLLKDSERQRLQDALRHYARTRFRLPHEQVVSTEANEAAIARSETAQAEIWPAALRGAETLPAPLAALLISATNDVLDAHLVRVAALRDRVPGSVVLLTVAIAGGALFTAGQAAGYRGDTRFWRALVYAVSVALVVTLILDFDRPSRGLILVDLEPLVSTWEAMVVTEPSS
jgi:hypothetical protein